MSPPRHHAAPMGLAGVLFGFTCYKHAAPTELGLGRRVSELEPEPPQTGALRAYRASKRSAILNHPSGLVAFSARLPGVAHGAQPRAE